MRHRGAKLDRFGMRKTPIAFSHVPEHADEPIDFILAKFPRVKRVFDVIVQLFEPDAVHFLGAAIGGIDVRTRENHYSANEKIIGGREITQLIVQ